MRLPSRKVFALHMSCMLLNVHSRCEHGGSAGAIKEIASVF